MYRSFVSLGRYTSKYFILFVAMVNGIVSLISLSELMLLNCGVEKTLESPLDCKEIQPVHPKGNQS